MKKIEEANAEKQKVNRFIEVNALKVLCQKYELQGPNQESFAEMIEQASKFIKKEVPTELEIEQADLNLISKMMQGKENWLKRSEF